MKCASGLVLMAIVALLIGCDTTPETPDISNSDVTVKIARFDRELFHMVPDSASVRGPELRKRYGKFLNVYCRSIVPGVSGASDRVLFFNLGNFLKDPNIRGLAVDVEQSFPDLSSIETELTTAFRYYHHYFPDSLVPRVVSMVSVFGAQIASLDSTLAIGLDMYMGKDYQYYAAMNFPQYQTRTMTRDYIVVDALHGWLETTHAQQGAATNMQSRMIHAGKVLYALESVLPQMPDSMLLSYSTAQLNWCHTNEFNIWAHFVDKELFFVTDEIQIMSFLGDGPFTSDFARESPAGVGNWLGWQIVRAFMKNNPDVTLEQLFALENPQAILDQSGYKPDR